jgi:hypothetical protein
MYRNLYELIREFHYFYIKIILQNVVVLLQDIPILIDLNCPDARKMLPSRRSAQDAAEIIGAEGRRRVGMTGMCSCRATAATRGKGSVSLESRINTAKGVPNDER